MKSYRIIKENNFACFSKNENNIVRSFNLYIRYFFFDMNSVCENGLLFSNLPILDYTLFWCYSKHFISWFHNHNLHCIQINDFIILLLLNKERNTSEHLSLVSISAMKNNFIVFSALKSQPESLKPP